MTFRDKLKEEHPEKCGSLFVGGCSGCPVDYEYEEKARCNEMNFCSECWDRQIESDDDNNK